MFLDKVLETQILTQEEIENLNRPVTCKKVELVIKTHPKNGPGPDGFPGNFIKFSNINEQSFSKFYT